MCFSSEAAVEKSEMGPGDDARVEESRQVCVSYREEVSTR